MDSQGEDARYLALARKITKGIDNPLKKTLAIAKYLSEQSLYTRKPGHQVTAKGDPVAPYLFSDEMRGYCVHFAHSAVYMMRLLGIPSRIGTGYLVDLSYAKDGHILLQLGDRHAWPEVYLEGYGWLVFDVTPTRAENEPELVPDENLLEELMSKLAPAEALLEPLPLADDKQSSSKMLLEFLDSSYFWMILVLAIFSLLLAKLWLRYSYLLPANSRLRTIRAYRSFSSLMIDRGYPRLGGETRLEYARRLKETAGLKAEEITLLYQSAVYSPKTTEATPKQLHTALKPPKESYRPKHRTLRSIASSLNMASLLKWRRW